MTYAKNAIRYYKKFQDDKGIHYLQNARQYVDDELLKVDYHPANIVYNLTRCKNHKERLLD